jgi:hypothetical protein
MINLPEISFTLDQIYLGAARHGLNTCNNPDCMNFGHAFETNEARKAKFALSHRHLSLEQASLVEMHDPGAYRLSGADKRVSSAFEYQGDPHAWVDQRTVRCKAKLLNGTICDTRFSILSDDHLEAEVERLRNHNGVLDGPACQACGTRYLDKPEEIVLAGSHHRTKDAKGTPITHSGAPEAVRVFHRPCKGRKGAKITIALPHRRQKETTDNLRIVHEIINSAGVLDIRRTIGADSAG